MTTNAPDVLSTPQAPSEAAPRAGLVSATVTWIQQGLCGLHGHDSLLHHTRNRMFLRCTTCGYETPGWDLSRAPRPVAARAEVHAARPADLAVVARKIA
jgi:hypothetical protein